MADLRIRAYNVRFGDAVLVSVPDADEQGVPRTRHLLIDVGNALVKQGQDDVFAPVFGDIAAETGGRIDLYVNSHEHLDHVQGPLFAHDRLGIDLTIEHIWLTASAEDGYYDRFPEAKRKRAFAEAQLRMVDAAIPAGERDDWLAVLLANNGYPGALAASHRRRQDCIDFLKGYQNPDGSPCHKSYVFRRSDGGAWPHPFRIAKLDVWAPEEDTSVYYGPFQPAALGALSGGMGWTGDADPTVLPPAGVDAGSFYNLVRMRTRAFSEALLRIDAAENDSSVILHLEWKGWHLLFPGDAEERSYQEMDKRGLLAPVHFLKVGHHGSHNGTAPDPLLDAYLPPQPHDGRPRFAIVSTAVDAYSGVPDAHTLTERIGPRASLFDTRDVDPGTSIDIVLTDPG